MADAVNELAQALLRARGEGSVLDAGAWSEAVPDAAAAYRVQDAVDAALAAGTAPRAWKSGGASRTAPLTHAPLPPAGVLASPADARGLPLNLLRIEAEVALRLGQAVPPDAARDCTQAQAEAWLDGMAVSIELVDLRWQQGSATPPLLKLADAQAHGALVLGAFVPFAPRDWAAQSCKVRIGAAPAQEFRGSMSLTDPAWLLPQWLRHATRNGATVPAGTVVTTGTWCGLLPAQHGDLVVATFEGIGEARVQL